MNGSFNGVFVDRYSDGNVLFCNVSTLKEIK